MPRSPPQSPCACSNSGRGETTASSITKLSVKVAEHVLEIARKVQVQRASLAMRKDVAQRPCHCAAAKVQACHWACHWPCTCTSSTSDIDVNNGAERLLCVLRWRLLVHHADGEGVPVPRDWCVTKQSAKAMRELESESRGSSMRSVHRLLGTVAVCALIDHVLRRTICDVCDGQAQRARFRCELFATR